MKNTLRKEERISSKEDIDHLFESGDSFIAFPLRVIYLQQEKQVGISILVSVSKKKFKRAVKRNRVKRLIKESYRLNKSELSQFVSEKNVGLSVAFLYVGHDLCEYKKIEDGMQNALNTLLGIID